MTRIRYTTCEDCGQRMPRGTGYPTSKGGWIHKRCPLVCGPVTHRIRWSEYCPPEVRERLQAEIDRLQSAKRLTWTAHNLKSRRLDDWTLRAAFPKSWMDKGLKPRYVASPVDDWLRDQLAKLPNGNAA